jgi:ABC-type sugar transport system ATPase subunit
MTMVTQVAVMCEGHLQQSTPPMEIHRRSANQFVAEFAGNPLISLQTKSSHGFRTYGRILLLLRGLLTSGPKRRSVIARSDPERSESKDAVLSEAEASNLWVAWRLLRTNRSQRHSAIHLMSTSLSRTGRFSAYDFFAA